MAAYADADKGNNSGEYQGKANAMAEHFASFHKVVGAYEMSYLHGESHGYSRIDATAKPCRRFHKSYCRRRLGAKMTYHGGIDEKHHYGGDLC